MRLEHGRGTEARSVAAGRREVSEMHLFDDAAAEEMALCEAATPDEDRRSVRPQGWHKRQLRGWRLSRYRSRR